MKLIAKRPCSFNGEKFFIGDEIPTEYVLDPKAQKMMGVIEVVEGDSSNADPLAGGPLLPPAPTLENSEKTYSKTALSRMKKEELLSVAVKAGVEATAEMKNDDIVALILEKQGE